MIKFEICNPLLVKVCNADGGEFVGWLTGSRHKDRTGLQRQRYIIWEGCGVRAFSLTKAKAMLKAKVLS